MPQRSQWTVGENEMAIEPVFGWLGEPPWLQPPPSLEIAEWAKALYEREPRHSEESWDAKIRDVVSCLPIPTTRPYAGRPAGSERRIKDGANAPTIEGPSTRELVERRLAAISGEPKVPVEYDSLGLSTGVEAEGQAPEPLIHDPFDPAKIDVITRTMTVDLMLARIRRGVLDLAPDFQRFAGIWSDVAQSRLIESLLLRIPLPTLYAAESGEESWVVVDGIQRLTAIARFVDPAIVGASPLRLHGMEYLRTYERNTYQQLPGALQTRIDETELIVHLIRAGTPEPVKFNIFARLNTGGTPLTLQELRHALIPGRARTLLKELADGRPFRDATQGSVKPQRMADREMVLRFLAFRLTEPSDYPRGDLDDFLRQAMKRLNGLPEQQIQRLSSEFASSMENAEAVFGRQAFRKIFTGQLGRLPINKALFEAESVGLAKLSGHELAALRQRQERVVKRLAELMEDGRFLQAISVGTGDAQNVRLRFSTVQNMLKEVAND
jgi:hypothetical protein